MHAETELGFNYIIGVLHQVCETGNWSMHNTSKYTLTQIDNETLTCEESQVEFRSLLLLPVDIKSAEVHTNMLYCWCFPKLCDYSTHCLPQEAPEHHIHSCSSTLDQQSAECFCVLFNIYSECSCRSLCIHRPMLYFWLCILLYAQCENLPHVCAGFWSLFLYLYAILVPVKQSESSCIPIGAWVLSFIIAFIYPSQGSASLLLSTTCDLGLHPNGGLLKQNGMQHLWLLHGGSLPILQCGDSTAVFH